MKNSILIISISILFFACKKDKTPPEDNTNTTTETCDISITSSTNVKGYGILSRLPGIWNGSLYSPTPLGSFPEWIVDFRPISASQVSAKNELDSINDIFMSFFIVKHDCSYKMGFRNGGGFAGNTRTSYMIIDSVSETSGSDFYRFVDPVKGKNRVYTELTFKQDSLIMHTYTNVYNTLSQPETHFIWRADLRDSSSAQPAIAQFNFPQKSMVKDFSTTFDSLTEGVYYNPTNDPYPETSHPYLGQSNITVNISNPATVDPAKKVLILITTQPLFNGTSFNAANLDYRSRYVLVGAQTTTGFNFNYMHPGDYYVNAIYDSNGDQNFSSGDYMNLNFDIPFTLTDQGTANATVNINFQVP